MSSFHYTIHIIIGTLFLIASFLCFREYQSNSNKSLYKDCWLWKCAGLIMTSIGIFSCSHGVYMLGGLTYCIGSISYNTIKIVHRNRNKKNK